MLALLDKLISIPFSLTGKSLRKIDARARGVAQVLECPLTSVRPEFTPQYCKKKKSGTVGEDLVLILL
jgi:ribosomal protein L13E